MNSRITIEQASCIAKKYLNSLYETKDEFARKNKLQVKDLRLIKKILKDGNEQLYMDFINNRKNTDYTVLNDQLDQILNGIRFGIDGRKFDLLDYYLITKQSFKVIDTVLVNNNRSFEDQKLLRTFFYKNSSSVPDYLKSQDISNKNILNKDFILRAKTTIRGYEVTQEDKLEVFRFMEENELPNYMKIYSIAIKRLVSEKQNSKQKIIVKLQ